MGADLTEFNFFCDRAATRDATVFFIEAGFNCWLGSVDTMEDNEWFEQGYGVFFQARHLPSKWARVVPHFWMFYKTMRVAGEQHIRQWSFAVGDVDTYSETGPVHFLFGDRHELYGESFIWVKLIEEEDGSYLQLEVSKDVRSAPNDFRVCLARGLHFLGLDLDHALHGTTAEVSATEKMELIKAKQEADNNFRLTKSKFFLEVPVS